MPNSTRDEIVKLVREYIDEEMQFLTGSVYYSDGENLYDVCGLDGLDILEILMHMEETLSIEMPDQDYVSVNDFADAAEKIV